MNYSISEIDSLFAGNSIKKLFNVGDTYTLIIRPRNVAKMQPRRISSTLQPLCFSRKIDASARIPDYVQANCVNGGAR